MKTDIGAPDRCESYALVQDDVFGNMSYLTHPDATESHRSTFSSFLRHAHSIVNRILSVLDTGLGLQRVTLASLVSQDRTSGTLLRLTTKRVNVSTTAALPSPYSAAYWTGYKS